MSAKIYQFTGQTVVALDPNNILNGAVGKLRDCTVLGWTPEGELYLASSTASLPEIIWLLENAKQAFVAMGE